MKNKLLLLLLVIVSNVITYVVTTGNNQKDFEAAYLQADFIHYLMDNEDSILYNPGAEIEEAYYEWFQDLDYGVYNTKHLTLNNLESYSWCY